MLINEKVRLFVRVGGSIYFFTMCSSVGSSTEDESKTVDSCRMAVDVHQVQSRAVPGQSSSKPSLIRPKPLTTGGHQNILSVETITKSVSVNVSDNEKATTASKSFPLPLTGAHRDKTIASAQANSKLTADTNHTKPTTTAHSITNPKTTAAEDKCKSKLMTNVDQSKQTLPAQINPRPATPAQAKPKPMIVTCAQDSPFPTTTINDGKTNPARSYQVQPKASLVNEMTIENEDNRHAEEMR